jgi:hypothetical protein
MLRGVRSDQVVPDANHGCRRLSSALFKSKPPKQDYLSFNSQPCIEARGDNPIAYMADRVAAQGWVGVVSISVAAFRAFDVDAAGQRTDTWLIGMVPLPNEQPPDPCHGAAWVAINDNKANRIRRVVEWFIEIPDVVIDETQLA